MANVHLKRIKRDPTQREVAEYLDELVCELTLILENIDEENLTDKLREKIGGK